jgi:hypothetical protein
LVLFVRIGTFQWVTTNPNKKIVPIADFLNPNPSSSRRAAIESGEHEEDNTGFCFHQEIVDSSGEGCSPAGRLRLSEPGHHPSGFKHQSRSNRRRALQSKLGIHRYRHSEPSAPKNRKPQSDPPSKVSRWGFGISSLFTIFVARQNGWPRLCLNNGGESL